MNVNDTLLYEFTCDEVELLINVLETQLSKLEENTEERNKLYNIFHKLVGIYEDETIWTTQLIELEDGSTRWEVRKTKSKSERERGYW